MQVLELCTRFTSCFALRRRVWGCFREVGRCLWHWWWLLELPDRLPQHGPHARQVLASCACLSTLATATKHAPFTVSPLPCTPAHCIAFCCAARPPHVLCAAAGPGALLRAAQVPAHAALGGCPVPGMVVCVFAWRPFHRQVQWLCHARSPQCLPHAHANMPACVARDVRPCGLPPAGAARRGQAGAQGWCWLWWSRRPGGGRCTRPGAGGAWGVVPWGSLTLMASCELSPCGP